MNNHIPVPIITMEISTQTELDTNIMNFLELAKVRQLVIHNPQEYINVYEYFHPWPHYCWDWGIDIDETYKDHPCHTCEQYINLVVIIGDKSEWIDYIINQCIDAKCNYIWHDTTDLINIKR